MTVLAIKRGIGNGSVTDSVTESVTGSVTGKAQIDKDDLAEIE